jgi:hypothetical protein
MKAHVPKTMWTHTTEQDSQSLPPLSADSGPGRYSIPPISSWGELPKWLVTVFREELILGNMPTYILEGQTVDYWVAYIDSQIGVEKKVPQKQRQRKPSILLRIFLRALQVIQIPLRRISLFSYLTNVKDQPAVCLARAVRKHGT